MHFLQIKNLGGFVRPKHQWGKSQKKIAPNIKDFQTFVANNTARRHLPEYFDAANFLDFKILGWFVTERF